MLCPYKITACDRAPEALQIGHWLSIDIPYVCLVTTVRFSAMVDPAFHGGCHHEQNHEARGDLRPRLNLRQAVGREFAKLRKVADLREWAVVEVYKDEGISGAKGREKRPGLDAMLNDASKRKFDMVMSWAVDRLGRNLRDLLGTIEHLKACKVGLYLDQQHLDTSTPAGEAMLQMVGVFAQFERATIQQRINAGLSVVKEKLARDGKFETRGGKVRTRLGRPGAKSESVERARELLASGMGIGRVARDAKLGVGTVHKLAREMRGTA